VSIPSRAITPIVPGGEATRNRDRPAANMARAPRASECG